MPSALFDPDRIAAVQATGLLDTGAEESFDRLTRLAAVVLEAPYAFVTLVDDRRSFWKSCIGIDADDLADRQNTIEESFCQYVVGSGEPLIVGDTVAEPLTHDNPSNESLGVRAWAGFPIRAAGGQVLGTFCVVDTVVRDWNEHHRETLATLAHAASGEIRLRMAADEALAFARNLQDSLIPEHLPDVPGLEIAATHLPALGRGGVLGDFYDVFRSHDGHWHVAIGDVCGHGVEAAKTTALARWSMHTAANHTSDPDAILRDVHEVLHGRGADLFLTAQVATFDLTGSQPSVTMALAGHPPALLRRADGTVERIGPGGQLLGMIPNPRIVTRFFALQPGDALVLSTDGLTEARHDGELLETDRVCERLRDTPPTSAAAIVEALVELATSWSTDALRDDLAVVVVMPVSAR